MCSLAPMEGRSLRPLGIGETLDAAFNLYFRNFILMLRITAAVVIPVIVLTIILLLIGIQETDRTNPDAAFYEVGAGEFRFVDESTFLVTSIIAAVLGGLAYLLVIAAVFRAASERYVGRPVTASESLGAGLRRVHSVLWIFILMLLAFFLVVIPVAFGPVLLLFAIPFLVFLIVRWCVAIPALMVERAKGSKALSRSFVLVEHRWWPVFGALIVGLIFIGLIEFLTTLAGEGLSSLAEEQTTLFVIVFSIMNGIGTLITAPFQAAIVTVIYYDLRVRKEAYDVELMTEQLGAPPAPAAGEFPPPGETPPPPPPPPGEPSPPGSTPPPPPPPPSTPSGW